MKTYIVLIPIKNTGGRKYAEKIQETVYDSVEEFIKPLKQKLGGLYDLDAFMDACNDEEIFLEHYWVSYIHVKK